MKIYIAGKISGYANAKKEFQEVEDNLNKSGHTALNPSVLPEGFEQEDYHHICRAMIDICDAVYFRPIAKAHMEMGYTRQRKDNYKMIEKIRRNNPCH